MLARLFARLLLFLVVDASENDKSGSDASGSESKNSDGSEADDHEQGSDESEDESWVGKDGKTHVIDRDAAVIHLNAAEVTDLRKSLEKSIEFDAAVAGLKKQHAEEGDLSFDAGEDKYRWSADPPEKDGGDLVNDISEIMSDGSVAESVSTSESEVDEAINSDVDEVINSDDGRISDEEVVLQYVVYRVGYFINPRLHAVPYPYAKSAIFHTSSSRSIYFSYFYF